MTAGMICISVLLLLFYANNLLPVTLGSPDSLILVAELGDDVTVWCQYDPMQAAYIYWFKQTDSSVPDQLQCQLYKKHFAASPCNVVNQNNHMLMSVNSQNSSLTIPAVNHSDSGLYYCGIWQSNSIYFSNATHLQVREQEETLPDHSTQEVFATLSGVFGGVIVVLIIVLLVMLKNRKQHTDTGSIVKKEQDSNYADLQFSNKNIKKAGRHSEMVDPHVVYSTVKP
ncbi:uncharacterized protein LOC143509689 isoform X1 [Brachyhypopomus gauderio]|uniref:uncharacterized protein LOC143509689 isoform X1 n=1 Tax=Brachyhypopomus gauderio TaxID=698409 RepID=UPI00404388E5